MTASEVHGSDRKFESVWHAQLFAMTIHLHEQGVFTWPEWTDVLGEYIKTHYDRTASEQNTEDSYYLAWMDALLDCLKRKGITDNGEVQKMRDKWSKAYLSTPHGQPVTLR